MNSIRAVVFDLDDTLYPEREYAFSGFAAVSAAFADVLGDPATAAADMRRLFDTEHRSRVFDALLAERGLSGVAQSTSPLDKGVPERGASRSTSPLSKGGREGGIGDLVARMVETYRSHDPAIRLYPDADTALTRLRGRYSLGLITDGPAVQQWKKIDALGIRDRVSAITVTSELGPGLAKPHPRAFELMAERLGLAHDACCYVADNPAKDFVAPNRLGWRTIRIVRDDGIYRDAAAAGAGNASSQRSTLDAIDGLLVSAV